MFLIGLITHTLVPRAACVRPRLVHISIALVGAIVFASQTIYTQSDDANDDRIYIHQADLAPPPLSNISREERLKLGQKKGLNERTKLSLELMNARIKAAEDHSSRQYYDGVFRELGGFQGLMENCFGFLEKNHSGRGKVLDNYKRFEIALRGYIPRLENIRRDIPIKYEDYVRKLMRYVRDTRAKSVEPMFGNTVVKPRTNFD